MTVVRALLRGVGAYAIAQVLTGVELGVLIAVGVLVWDWGPATIGAVMPVGLLLVLVQMPVLVHLLTPRAPVAA